MGCKATTDGTLRVVDLGAGQVCRPSESTITWNRRGDTGPPGRDSVGAVVRRTATYATATHPGRMEVRCAEGTRALSWGYSFNTRGSRVVDAGPLPAGVGWWIQPGRVGGYPPTPGAEERTTVYVLCAPSAAFATATTSAGPSSGVRMITACRRSGGATRIISPPAHCRAERNHRDLGGQGAPWWCRRAPAPCAPDHRVEHPRPRRPGVGRLSGGNPGLDRLASQARPVSGHGPLEDGAGWQVAVLGTAAPISVSVICIAPRAVVEPVEDGPSLTGCRTPATGAFRMLSGGSCTSAERAVTWRQRGRTGFTGASGQLLDYVAVQDARFEPPASIPGTVLLSAQCDLGHAARGRRDRVG